MLVYSGRPDPEWPVEDILAEKWLNIYREAPQVSEPVPETVVLGYRGIQFYGGGEYYTVSNGYIRHNNTLKQDAGRKLEKTILQTASKALQQMVTKNFNKE